MSVGTDGTKIGYLKSATSKGLEIGEYDANGVFQRVAHFYNGGGNVVVEQDIEKAGANGFMVTNGGTDLLPASDTLMFVSNNRTQINFAPVAKGVSGGFAVGQYGTAKAAAHKDYLTVEHKGTTIGFDYGVSGGFAVGQYGTAKGTFESFMTINGEGMSFTMPALVGFGSFSVNNKKFTTTDKTQLLLNENISRITVGNAVTGLEVKVADATNSNLMELNSENILIGYKSDNIIGTDNIILGSKSGMASTTYNDGANNVIIGKGNLLNHGNDNIVIGNNSSTTANPKDGKAPFYSSSNIVIGNSLEAHDGQLVIGNNGLVLMSGNLLDQSAYFHGRVSMQKVLNLVPQATAPVTPQEGDLYVGIDHHIYCYLNGVWKQLDN
jgi:hypothetical protein